MDPNNVVGLLEATEKLDKRLKVLWDLLHEQPAVHEDPLTRTRNYSVRRILDQCSATASQITSTLKAFKAQRVSLPASLTMETKTRFNKLVDGVDVVRGDTEVARKKRLPPPISQEQSGQLAWLRSTLLDSLQTCSRRLNPYKYANATLIRLLELTRISDRDSAAGTTQSSNSILIPSIMLQLGRLEAFVDDIPSANRDTMQDRARDILKCLYNAVCETSQEQQRAPPRFAMPSTQGYGMEAPLPMPVAMYGPYQGPTTYPQTPQMHSDPPPPYTSNATGSEHGGSASDCTRRSVDTNTFSCLANASDSTF